MALNANGTKALKQIARGEKVDRRTYDWLAENEPAALRAARKGSAGPAKSGTRKQASKGSKVDKLVKGYKRYTTDPAVALLAEVARVLGAVGGVKGRR